MTRLILLAFVYATGHATITITISNFGAFSQNFLCGALITPQTVPEPSSFLLGSGVGVAGLLIVRRQLFV